MLALRHARTLKVETYVRLLGRQPQEQHHLWTPTGWQWSLLQLNGETAAQMLYMYRTRERKEQLVRRVASAPIAAALPSEEPRYTVSSKSNRSFFVVLCNQSLRLLLLHAWAT